MTTDTPDTDNSPAKMGRPSVFSPEIDREILERLAQGESLIDICSDARMPSRTAVLNRLRHDVAFAAAEDEARDIAVKAWLDEANHLTRAAVEAPGSREQLTALRIRLDFVHRSAENHKPRRIEVTGAGGGAIQLQAVGPPLPPAEVRRYVRSLLPTAEAAAGLASDETKSDRERVAAILKSGVAPHPDLIDALADVDDTDAA